MILCATNYKEQDVEAPYANVLVGSKQDNNSQ